VTLLTPLHIFAVIAIWFCTGGWMFLLEAGPEETRRHRIACRTGALAVLAGAAGFVWWVTKGGR
jgi:hypothetical protein